MILLGLTSAHLEVDFAYWYCCTGIAQRILHVLSFHTITL